MSLCGRESEVQGGQSHALCSAEAAQALLVAELAVSRLSTGLCILPQEPNGLR